MSDNETRGAHPPLVLPPGMPWSPGYDPLADIRQQLDYLNKRLMVLEEQKLFDKLRDLTSRLDGAVQALQRIDRIEQQLQGNAVLNKRDTDKVSARCDTLASEIGDTKDSLRKTCERLNAYAEKMDKITGFPFSPERPDVKDRDVRDLMQRVTALEDNQDKLREAQTQLTDFATRTNGFAGALAKRFDALGGQGPAQAPQAAAPSYSMVLVLQPEDLAKAPDLEWQGFYEYMIRTLVTILKTEALGPSYDVGLRLWIKQFENLAYVHQMRAQVNKGD